MSRKCIALSGDCTQLPLKIGIGFVVATQRSGGNLQTGEAENSNRSRDLFVGFGQKEEVRLAVKQRRRKHAVLQRLHQGSAIVCIIVSQSSEQEHGRTNIGMVRPNDVLHTLFVYSRADQSEERAIDLRIDTAMVPGEAGIDDESGRARGEEEIVGIAEHYEIRSPLRITGDHVKQLHLDRIGEISREVNGLSSERIEGGYVCGCAFEFTGGGGTSGVNVESGSHVEVKIECRGGKPGILRVEHSGKVGIDFAKISGRIGTRER